MKRTVHIPKLGREQVLETGKLTNAEVRFVVSDYYAAQDARKRADMQLRHLGDKATPSLLVYTADCNAVIEQQVKRGLDEFASNSRIGQWCLAQHGVGGIITAGLLAHLDIEQAPTAGHFWSFAGLLPKDVKPWKKGEKRPYNAALKQITFHLGECFKRSSNHPDSVYGKIYRERKALLVERNDAGFNAERAKTFVTKSKEVNKTLSEGKLPAGNLDRQAGNYAAKIFLSHLHAIMLWEKYQNPTLPYSIAMMNHAHMIAIPHVEMFPGLQDALRRARMTQKAA